MIKRIHILTADEHERLLTSTHPEPPYPVGTYFAVEVERWEIKQIINYRATEWTDRTISVHQTKQEATQALMHLLSREKHIKRGPQADRKHYWLTPPEVMEPIKAEFGPNIFDPSPYPRPPGFNGLDVEWGEMNWVNPLFRRKTDGVGISDWVKKMIVEQEKGRTSLLVYPTYNWFHMLLNAGAKMRSLGQVHWLAIEDGTPQKASLPIILFILRGKKKKK